MGIASIEAGRQLPPHFLKMKHVFEILCIASNADGAASLGSLRVPAAAVGFRKEQLYLVYYSLVCIVRCVLVHNTYCGMGW